MSEYSLVDEGEVILVKDQQIILDRLSQTPVNHGATINAAGDNIVSYSGITFTRDDTNVHDGVNHRTWTAIENAVSNLDIHSGDILSETLTVVTQFYDIGFVVPSQGCFRIWTTPFGCELKHNGANLGDIWNANGARSYASTLAIKTIPGDTFEINRAGSNVGEHIYWNFLPYVYSN